MDGFRATSAATKLNSFAHGGLGVSYLPLCFQPPIEAGKRILIVAPFAKMIDDWRASRQPVTTGNARIEIELKVFGATTEAKQPLIQVRELTHGVSDGG